MNLIRLERLLCAAAMLVGFFALPVHAQTVKRGFAGDVNGQAFECPTGSFLVGVVLNQTDRMIGMRFVCAPAAPGARWASLDAAGVQATTIGNVTSGTKNRITNSTCPHDFFLIGLRGTIGEYHGSSAAIRAVPADLLADVAPVCREAGGAIFAFNDSRLIEADDNNLRIRNWDGVNGSRTCGAGEAAAGMRVAFETRRNDDPSNIFTDAALICRRLPRGLGSNGTNGRAVVSGGGTGRGRRGGN